MKGLLQLLKSFDIFGKPLFLNFDRQWNSYDTKIGGCSTSILLIFIFTYTGILFNMMINYGQDTIKTVQNEINQSIFGDIYLNSTKILFFAWIQGSRVKNEDTIENLLPYADIYFEQQVFDLKYGPNTTVSRIPIKRCTQDDFGYEQIDIDFFQSWYGVPLICGDFTQDNKMYLSNDGKFSKYSQININFDKCNSSLSTNCASDEEIQDFFKDFTI